VKGQPLCRRHVVQVEGAMSYCCRTHHLRPRACRVERDDDGPRLSVSVCDRPNGDVFQVRVGVAGIECCMEMRLIFGVSLKELGQLLFQLSLLPSSAHMQEHPK
jgi:hypothetical protein